MARSFNKLGSCDNHSRRSDSTSMPSAANRLRTWRDHERKDTRTHLKYEEEPAEIFQKEKIKKVARPTFYDPYKTVIYHLLFIGTFAWSAFNILIRNIFFSIVILFYMFTIFFKLRQRLLDTNISRFNFVIDIFTVILLTVGLFNSKIGFYAAFCCILTQVIGLCRFLSKTYRQGKNSTNTQQKSESPWRCNIFSIRQSSCTGWTSFISPFVRYEVRNCF